MSVMALGTSPAPKSTGGTTPSPSAVPAPSADLPTPGSGVLHTATGAAGSATDSVGDTVMADASADTPAQDTAMTTQPATITPSTTPLAAAAANVECDKVVLSENRAVVRALVPTPPVPDVATRFSHVWY